MRLTRSFAPFTIASVYSIAVNKPSKHPPDPDSTKAITRAQQEVLAARDKAITSMVMGAVCASSVASAFFAFTLHKGFIAPNKPLSRFTLSLASASLGALVTAYALLK